MHEYIVHTCISQMGDQLLSLMIGAMVLCCRLTWAKATTMYRPVVHRGHGNTKFTTCTCTLVLVLGYKIRHVIKFWVLLHSSNIVLQQL